MENNININSSEFIEDKENKLIINTKLNNNEYKKTNENNLYSINIKNEDLTLYFNKEKNNFIFNKLNELIYEDIFKINSVFNKENKNTYTQNTIFSVIYNYINSLNKNNISEKSNFRDMTLYKYTLEEAVNQMEDVSCELKSEYIKFKKDMEKKLILILILIFLSKENIICEKINKLKEELIKKIIDLFSENLDSSLGKLVLLFNLLITCYIYFYDIFRYIPLELEEINEQLNNDNGVISFKVNDKEEEIYYELSLPYYYDKLALNLLLLGKIKNITEFENEKTLYKLMLNNIFNWENKKEKEFNNLLDIMIKINYSLYLKDEELKFIYNKGNYISDFINIEKLNKLINIEYLNNLIY